MNRKIVIVEDDILLRESLKEQLEQNGYSVSEAGSVGECESILKNEDCDAILLDVGLPDMDGREGCRRMREQGVQIPIIMLTAHDTEMDVVSGFDAGSNDYIPKPFRIAELLARLQSHLRQHERREDATYTIGLFQFLPGERKLLDNQSGDTVLLTEKECGILKYLYRADGGCITREDLLKEVWGYNSGVMTHTLETHIYRLRRKLESKEDSPRVLFTESGGYRLYRRGKPDGLA